MTVQQRSWQTPLIQTGNPSTHLTLLQLVCRSWPVGVQDGVLQSALVLDLNVVQGQVLSLKLTSQQHL